MKEDIFHLGIKALIRNREGKILLLKVSPRKFTVDKKRGLTAGQYWDIPGGRIKKEGKVIDTLKREIREETGFSKAKDIKEFTMVLSNIRVPNGDESAGLILYIFTCKIDDKQKLKLSDEHVEAKWFSPKRAAKLLEVKYPSEFTERIKLLSKK